MALIKFGTGVAGISGKIGGTVYARNKSGAYARNWAKPTTTPTPSQTVNRNRFGNQAQAWTALAAASKNSWDSYASTVTRLNRQGEAYTPTGRQIFLEANNQLASIGSSTLPTAPPPGSSGPTISPVTDVIASVASGVLASITFAGRNADVDMITIIDATPPTGGNITNFSNLFRQITKIVGDVQTPVDILAAYTAAFTDVAASGNVIAFRARLMAVATGLTGPPVIFIATIP